jgi:hypothetical protein
MNVKIEFTEQELLALNKVLNFIRFGCTVYDARYLASSPIIAELDTKIIEILRLFYEKRGVPLPTEWPRIEELKHYLETIKAHIKNTDNWISLTFDQKTSFVKILVYPYRVLDQTIADLITFGDSLHLK